MDGFRSGNARRQGYIRALMRAQAAKEIMIAFKRCSVEPKKDSKL